MNNRQIEAGLLINEWQLGSQLNIAVANGTREKFNLLLSLLSDDARDFPQFELPNAIQGSLSTLELRESLCLAEAQPLVNRGNSLKQAQKLSISMHNKDLTDIRLQSLLNNEAVLSRFNKENFDAEIVDNLSLLSQARLKSLEAVDKDKQRNANGVDYALVESYQALNLKNNPVKVSYM